MESVTLVAPDISCEHCKHTVEAALGEMPGVESVDVDIAAKSARVTFDAAQTTIAGLRERLDEEGYPTEQPAAD